MDAPATRPGSKWDELPQGRPDRGRDGRYKPSVDPLDYLPIIGAKSQVRVAE